jgi:hypothetical protein
MPVIGAHLPPVSISDAFGFRVCKRCRGAKPADDFSFVRRSQGRLQAHPWCDACKREYNTRWMRTRRAEKRKQNADASKMEKD